MPNNNETTTKFKVDISDLKKGIQEATRQIRLANAEFKAASSGMDNWQKSTDGVSKKIASLEKVLSSQNKILDSYKEQLKLIIAEYGENSKAADEMKIKIANQEAAINKTTKEINGYKTSLSELEQEQQNAANSTKDQTSAYNGLQTEIGEQETALSALKKEYANVVLEQGKNSDAAEALAGDISELSGKLTENKKKLSEADTAADEFDKSLDDLDDGANTATSGGLNVFTVALGNLVSNVISSAINKMKELVVGTIEVGKTFDSSMSNVAALSGATSKDLEMLRDTAKQFGSTTKFSASEAANALGYMALAGWDAQTSADALGGVLDLAAASGMDLASASDMVTDYMSAFNMEAKDSTYFADLLAYAQANANTTVQGLGDAFKNSAANMNAAGQDIETTTSLLAMMANQGLKGSEAGTALTAVMRDMTAKMEDGAIKIGETSVQVTDANGNYRDMTDILMDVEAATKGMGDAEKAAALSSTFTSDSIKGLNLILNAGVSEAAKFEEELRNSSGTAKETAKIMNDNLGGDLTNLNSKLKGVQIAIYEKFEPALRSGVDALSKLLDVVQFVVDHSTEFIAAIAAMAAGIAAYVAYTTALKVMKDGWMALTVVEKGAAAAQAVLNAVMSANPIGVVIALIAGLVAAFVVLWNKSEGFREFWIGLWDKIKEAAGSAWEWIKTNVMKIVDGFTDALKTAFNKIKSTVTSVWNTIKTITSKVWDGIKTAIMTVLKVLVTLITGYLEIYLTIIKTTFNAIKTVVTTIWNGIKAITSTVWNAIKTAITTVVNAIKTSVSNTFNAVKTVVTTVWNAIKSKTSEVWNAIKSKISDVVSGIKTSVSNTFNSVKSTVSSIWNSIKSTTSSVWNGIKTAITKPIEDAKTAVKKVIDAIKGFFNFKFSWPKIPLPHFKITPSGWKIGDLLKGKIPSLGIDWYKTGGVFTKPTVLTGLGENGAEAIVPLEKNTQWIRATAKNLKESLAREGILSGGGSKETIVNNNYNFVQNNTSPKALSRLDIYRQTKNQLAFAKGV